MLLAECRGLGVERTHVTRRKRTRRRAPPKSTITEHTKNIFVTPRWFLPKKEFFGPIFNRTNIKQPN